MNELAPQPPVDPDLRTRVQRQCATPLTLGWEVSHRRVLRRGPEPRGALRRLPHTCAKPGLEEAAWRENSAAWMFPVKRHRLPLGNDHRILNQFFLGPTLRTPFCRAIGSLTAENQQNFPTTCRMTKSSNVLVIFVDRAVRLTEGSESN